MTPPTSWLGGIEQIFLLIFMLIVLVGIAGGDASMVLKPVFGIVQQIVMSLISLLSNLLMSLFTLSANLLISGFKLLAETLANASKSEKNR
ncbi:MAG: hypothetical protein K8F91_26290 [Candidatus Obscuribacterales bacterium]|nr:hypothetical protein [Candidatus Obscuribacterales bacterium]